MRAWIGCIASYNNGRLHGEWFDVSTDADENAAHIAHVLRTSPYPNVTKVDAETGETYATAEEAWIQDWEAPRPLIDLLGEYANPQALADAARLVETLEETFSDDDELAAVLEEMLDGQSTRELGSLADDAEEWISDHFAGRGDTLKEWCENYLEESGFFGEVKKDSFTETLIQYFDYESYARDLHLGGDISMSQVGGSVLVFWNH